MNIIAVDDEHEALQLLERAILEVLPEGFLYCFNSSESALKHAACYRIDAAFLDIHIDGMNGLLLAEKLQEINRKINIIFVTEHSKYLQEAFSLHASGYIKKPVSAKKIAFELMELRYPVTLPKGEVRIRTFGHFEVYAGGRRVHFRRSKSKEILAYLVDRRGGEVTRRELAGILWEDVHYNRQKQKQLQTLIDELKRALREVGVENIIIQEKGKLLLDVTKVDCDYYRFNRWDAWALNAYRGEYMVDYSWAELTTGALTQTFFMNRDSQIKANISTKV